jgi:hypothetical protein
MMGAFVYWNQNADCLGYQMKIVKAYQDKDLSARPDVIGTSETGTGVSGLAIENFSGDIHRTIPVDSISAKYGIAKTQRLSGEVLVQQLPFQSTKGATAYFNYMIGF